MSLRATTTLESTMRDFLRSTPESKIAGALARLGLTVSTRYPGRPGQDVIDTIGFHSGPDNKWGGTLWVYKSRCELYLASEGPIGVYTTKTAEEMVCLLNYVAKYVMPKAEFHKGKERVRQMKNLMHRFSYQQEASAREFFKGLKRRLRWEKVEPGHQYVGYDDTFRAPGGVPKALEVGNWLSRLATSYKRVWTIDTFYHDDNPEPIRRMEFDTKEEAMDAADEWWFKVGRARMLKERPWRHMAEGKFRDFLRSAPPPPTWEEFLERNGFKYKGMGVTGWVKTFGNAQCQVSENAADPKKLVVDYYRRTSGNRWQIDSRAFIPKDDLPEYFRAKGLAEAYEPGSARKFFAKLGRGGIPGAVLINSGRKFRQLVSRYPADRVEVWKDPKDLLRGWGGVLIVVLKVSHGFGAYVKYSIREDWASYDNLRDRLRGWRNLQGAKLYIQGVPSGVVSSSNPALA